MLSRQGVIATLPNTQKQTQGGCQNEETKNTAQIKEQIKTPEKELNEIEISNLSDAEFKTLVIRMFEELSEDVSSIKKIQSGMKDSLIEIKNNLPGNDSRVNKTENQINDLEHKQAKTTNQENKEKKESKKMRIV